MRPPARRPFDRVVWHRVRLYDDLTRGLRRLARRLVLRLSGGRAVTLGNAVFLPDGARGDVGLLAHELTHCAQYQAWGAWRYFTRGAAAQALAYLHRTLGIGRDPYAYDLEPGKPLHAYGMEQQAQIIEDQVRQAMRQVTPRSLPPTAPGYCHPDRRSSP